MMHLGEGVGHPGMGTETSERPDGVRMSSRALDQRQSRSALTSAWACSLTEGC